MTDPAVRALQLPLTGFGAPPATARITVRTLTLAERLRRAALPPAAGLAAAILVLPIPIVHFAVPPTAILGGIVLGARRLFQRELFVDARGPCPFCGTDQSLGVNGTPYRLPRRHKCRACLKPLTLDAN